MAKYVGLAGVAGLDWPSFKRSATQRWSVVSCKADWDRPSHYVLPDYSRVHQELRRKGMTLMLLWEEHVAAHPGQSNYRYNQFYEKYRRYALRLKRSMRQIHRTGEKLFVDDAGPTVELVDSSRAHIFVAALGASSYTFVCATPRETMADWLHGWARAMSFSGGMLQRIAARQPARDDREPPPL